MSALGRFVPLARLADLRDQLENEVFFREGELTPELERQWDAIAGTARDKIYNTGLAHCEDLAAIAALDAELTRLTERKRLRENRMARRKEHLRQNMERLGIRFVEGPLCTVTLQKNSTLSITPAVTTNGPQPELFASAARDHHRRETRGNHVRIR